MLPYQTTIRKEDGIVIVGLGGAGANILQRFSGSSAENVRLCIMSLDERLGRECGNVEFVQLGACLNHGMGSGGDPDVALLAIQESGGKVDELLRGARLLVMVAGLGGGTGSGVAPVLARKAKEAGIFMVSVVVMPFGFEGAKRRKRAETALEEISAASDLVFCFENDYMEDLFRSRTGVQSVFEEANSLISQATASVPLLTNSPGIINIGLDELVTALDNNDTRCIYGSGKGFGPNRAVDAARAALESPLVAYHSALKHARTVIVHIAGGSNMSLTELRVAMETLREGLAGDDVNIFFGAAVKPRLGEELRVSVVASVDYREMQAVLLADAEEAEQEPAVAEEEVAESVASESAEDVTVAAAYAEVEEEEMAVEETGEPVVAEKVQAEESGEPLLEPDDEFPAPLPEPAPVPEPEPVVMSEPVIMPEPEPLPSWEPIPPVAPAPVAESRASARQGELNLDMFAGAAGEMPPADAMSRVEKMFGEDDELDRMMASHTARPVRTARGLNVFPKKTAMAAEEDITARVRSLFDDDADDEDSLNPQMESRPSSRTSSMGYNDMRDIFPGN